MQDSSGGDGRRPPHVFISYAHESDHHSELVRRLWILLRQCGVDARLDRVPAQRRQDWALWMADQVRDADHVLVIASAAYRRRSQGQSGPDEGRGVQFEARLIRDAHYADPRALDRFVPVVLPGQSREGVPDFLAPATCTVYEMKELSTAGAEPLLRLLLNQPEETEPPMGTPPVFATRDHSRPPVPPQPAELIADKTEQFVGRDNVFQAIEDFIADHTNGYLTIKGDPGAGKTTLLAEYVRRTGAVAHFNIRGQSLNTSAHFLQSLGGQLASRHGITGVALGTDPERYGEVLSRLVAEARANLPQTEPLVLVVDALDEVNTATDPPGVNVLFLPQHLPDGVYFVLSSRRASVALRTDVTNEVFDLGDHHADTMADVREYLRQQAKAPRLVAWLADRRIAEATFVEVLAGKSAGNFMYLRHVLPDLVAGRYADLDILHLPQGLEQYYESHWHLMGTGPATRLKIWVIYLLCEFARPVSAEVLARVLREVEPGADAIAVVQVLDEWRQFLHRGAPPVKYSLYHASFQDFLHRKDVIASAGLVLREVNGAIADVLWNHEYGS